MIRNLRNLTNISESGLLSRSAIKTSLQSPGILSVQIKVCFYICYYKLLLSCSIAISQKTRLLFCLFALSGQNIQKEELLAHHKTSCCDFQFRRYSQGFYSAAKSYLTSVLICTDFGSLEHSPQGEIQRSWSVSYDNITFKCS